MDPHYDVIIRSHPFHSIALNGLVVNDLNPNSYQTVNKSRIIPGLNISKRMNKILFLSLLLFSD